MHIEGKEGTGDPNTTAHSLRFEFAHPHLWQIHTLYLPLCSANHPKEAFIALRHGGRELTSVEWVCYEKSPAVLQFELIDTDFVRFLVI